MIAEEQDRTVARLRHELGAVGVQSHGEQVDRMLRRVHTRRREQRQHRMQMVAALAVVLIAVAGAFVVSWQPTVPDEATPALAVTKWDVRGELKGDTGLLQRAEAAWRGSGHLAPTGPVHTIYAGQRIDRLAGVVVVAMVAPIDADRSRVAFVTSSVSTNNAPDANKLTLRATTVVEPGQRAIGFVAATPLPTDEPVRGGGSLAFFLGAPGVGAVAMRTSLEDEMKHEIEGKKPPVSSDGAVWLRPDTGVGAWNAMIEVPSANGSKPSFARFAMGIADADTEPVALSTPAARLTAAALATDNAIKATGDVRAGDLIVTQQGVVGVVSDGDGTVDTRLTTLDSIGKIEIQRFTSGHLVDRNETVVFEPAKNAEEIRQESSVVFTKGSVTINVGKLAKSSDGWQVNRVVDPETATGALRVRLP